MPSREDKPEEKSINQKKIWLDLTMATAPPVRNLHNLRKPPLSFPNKIDNSIDFFSHADETKFSIFRLRKVCGS